MTISRLSLILCLLFFPHLATVAPAQTYHWEPSEVYVTGPGGVFTMSTVDQAGNPWWNYINLYGVGFAPDAGWPAGLTTSTTYIPPLFPTLVVTVTGPVPHGSYTGTFYGQFLLPWSTIASPVTVHVVPFYISQQPQSQSACAGYNQASFSVATAGATPSGYQWRKDGVAIPGATTASYSFTPTSTADAGSYDVVVSISSPSYYEEISDAATLTVNEPPVITQQPTSQTGVLGGSVTFSVVATGTPPLTYQWHKDGNLISGATGSSYTINDLSFQHEGSYYVWVYGCSGVQSNTVTLTVGQGPTITQQPQSATACAGYTLVSFSVTATGSPPLTYQWYKDGTLIPGATGAALSFTPLSLADAGGYHVVVTDTVGSTASNVATLTVQEPPMITQQPVSQIGCLGGSVTFSVVVSGTPPFTYQWYKDAGLISGATGPSYTINDLSFQHEGSYDVWVVGCTGVQSTAATLTVIQGPVITQQPQSQTVCEGAAVSFSVVAAGDPPLSYQWHRDGQPLAGATNSTHMIGAVQVADAGSYTVAVTNPCATIGSAAAILTVDEPPEITQQPQGADLCVGDALDLGVGVQGTPPFTFQWFKDGGALAGASGASYQVGAVDQNHAGSYSVQITNVCGQVASQAAVVTVTPAASILMHPVSQQACLGATVSFSVVADPAGVNYQWSHGGTSIPGATASVLTISPVAAADAGSYVCAVSNACGGANSQPATLTVDFPPEILVPPQSQAVCPGATAVFSVIADGTQPLVYQWVHDGTPLGGAFGSTLNLPAVGLAEVGTYHVVVTNTCGSVISGPATLSLLDPPVIATQPQGATACVGDTVNFTGSATGTAPFGYQWFKNGTNISGANGPTLTLPAVTAGDAGDYAVAVSNACGTATSNPATLVVLLPATITQQPASATVALGATVSFSVGAIGPPPLSYQWHRNGIAIPGAQGPALTVGPVGIADAGVYTVLVGNVCAPETSAPAWLDVLVPSPVPGGPGLVLGLLSDQLPPGSGDIEVAPAGFGALSGLVLVADRGTSALGDGQILAVSPASGAVTVFASASAAMPDPRFLRFPPSGTAFGSHLYVSSRHDILNPDLGVISRIAASGIASWFLTPNSSPPQQLYGGVGIAFFTATNNSKLRLFTGTPEGNAGDAITTFDSQGVLKETRSLGVYDGQATGMDMGGANFDINRVYFGVASPSFAVTSLLACGVFSFPGSGGVAQQPQALATSVTSPLITSVNDIAFGPGGVFGDDLYAADAAGRILRIDPGGTVTSLLDGFADVESLAFGGPQVLYFLERTTQSLYRVTPAPTGILGQRNGGAASLAIAGVGGGGPFPVSLVSGAPLTLHLGGPPNVPYLLVAGSATPAGAVIPCIGSIDVGTPPFYGDLIVVLDGALYPAIYALDADGFASLTVNLPPLPPGPFVNLQGVVFQPPQAPCGLGLTAAFYLDIE